MSKLAILSLHDGDVIHNILNYFTNVEYYGFYTVKNNVNATVESLSDKYNMFLIVNGLEELEDSSVHKFRFYKGKDSMNGDINVLTNTKIDNIIEEMIYNDNYTGVNTYGFVKNIINDLQDCKYLNNDNGGLFVKTDESSNVYVTINALQNIHDFDIPHFNVIYNNPYIYKVAVCMSGNIDSWPYVKGSFISNLLNGIDADVFIHTYSKENNIEDIFKDIPVKNMKVDDYNKVVLDTNNIANRLKSYKNFSIPVEDPITGSNTTKGTLHYIKMYSQYQCNELRKEYQFTNGIYYDLILHCDLNLLYFNTLSLNNINHNNIYTCYGITCGNIDPYFYISDPYNIDYICDNFKNILNLYSRNPDEPFSIQNAIRLSLKENNINIGGKVINASLQRENTVLYKHPDKWIRLSDENYQFVYQYLYNIQDIYKIQKFKDELVK